MKAVIATSAVVYAVNQPGSVDFTSPESDIVTDGTAIEIVGRISRAGVHKIGLDVNGTVIDVPVGDGSFQKRVPLAPGRNLVRPVSNELGVHVVNHTDSLTIHAVENPGPISFSSPTIGSIVGSKLVTVSGKVELAAGVQEHQLRTIGLAVTNKQAPLQRRKTVWSADVGAGGHFTAEVELEPGKNVIRGFSNDPNARLAPGSGECTVRRVLSQTAMADVIVDIESPSNNEHIFAGTTTVSGALSNAEITSVTIDGAAEEYTAAVTPTLDGRGRFEKIVRLKPGTSDITVTANGKSDSTRVRAPLVLHEFEQSTTGWRLSTKGKAVLDNSGHPGNCLSTANGAPPLDMVFVIDTSESMKMELGKIQEETQSIIGQLSRDKRTRFGFVGFGFGVTQISPLSGDVAAVRRSLGDLSINTEIVDREDQYLGILQAMSSDMDWRPVGESYRAVLIVTDEGINQDSFPRIEGMMPAPAEMDELEPDNIATRVTADGDQIGSLARFNLTWLIVTRKRKEEIRKEAMTDALEFAEKVQGKVIEYPGDPAETLKAIETIADRAVKGEWVAPADGSPSVLERLRNATNMTLAFDLRTKGDNGKNATPVVRLIAGKEELLLRLDEMAADSQWASYRVKLSEAEQWTDARTNKPVDRRTLVRVLSGLEELRIGTDPVSSAKITGIDNFMIVDTR